MYRAPQLLKRKLSVSAPDKCVGKRFFNLNVSTPSILLKCCTLIDYEFQPCILILPTETIENIFLLVVQPDDLHSLTHVNRLFASIACPVYATRLGIHVTNTSSIIYIRGNSFRALATWQRSRLFASIQGKCLYCEIDDNDHQLAKTQLQALRDFLSAPSLCRPFNTVDINSADSLSPPEILQFIQLIDSTGCWSASISSGLSNPKWLASSLSCSPKLEQPIVTLSHLRSLDINNQYFSPQQWSSLLPYLTGPDLEALFIRGQPTIRTLSKFLSRHSQTKKLRFAPSWGIHTIRSLSIPHNSLRLPLLTEMEGPPRHLQAILRCFERVPDALTIKIESDFRMTYLQYVRAVLDLVSLCGHHYNLKIHLYRYHDNNKLALHQLKSLSNITLPEVATLEISFASMSKRSFLVCPRRPFTKYV